MDYHSLPLPNQFSSFNNSSLFLKTFLDIFTLCSSVLVCRFEVKELKMEKNLSSVLVLFEVAGLQYFSLKSLTLENFKIRPSCYRFFYLIFLLVSISALNVFYFLSAIEIIKIDNVTDKKMLSFIVQNSLNFGLIVVAIVSLIQSFSSTPQMKEIFLNNKEIDRIYYESFGFILDYGKLRKEATRRVGILVCFFIFSNGGLTVARMTFCENQKSSFLEFISSVFPVSLLLLSALKFQFFVNMVNYQLCFLESVMKGIFHRNALCFADKKHFPIVEVVKINVKPFEDVNKKLKAALEVYSLIYENGRLINDSNGWTVLAFFFSLTMALTASGYELFVIAMGGLSIDYLPGITAGRFLAEFKY